MTPLPEPLRRALEAGAVPSPPQVLLRLLQMVSDDHASLADVARLVEQDGGLCARILGVANSPAFGRGRTLTSLEHCLHALGTRMVRTLATCLSIQSLFDKHTGRGVTDLGPYWAHALIVGDVARELARASHYSKPDEAYLAGLLHDIGELILLSALGDPYATLLSWNPCGTAREAEEHQRFGARHGELGSWLAEQWHLDSTLADGILFHHASASDILSAAPLPRLVWLAEAIASREHVDESLLAVQQTLLGHAEPDTLPALRQRAEARTRQLAEAIRLSLPGTLCAQGVWANLQTAPAAPLPAGDAELAAELGAQALLQPLQQDLLELESADELSLALREALRILFGLGQVGFLLASDAGDTLSGAGLSQQPRLFSDTVLPSALPAPTSPASAPSLATLAVNHARITSSFATDNPGALIDRQFMRALCSDGLLCVPLHSGGERLGVIICGVSGPHYAALEARLPWLQRFASLAARSLQAQRTAHQFRQQSEADAAAGFQLHARRVVHEAGNPLGIIKSYLKILDRRLPADPALRQELGILGEEIERVREIVGRLSAPPAPNSTDDSLRLDLLLQEMAHLYVEPLFRARGITYRLQAPPGEILVRCPRGILKQLILNLWKNAAEALSTGQHVTTHILDSVHEGGQAFCQLSIEDDGPGLPEIAMARLQGTAAPAASGPRGLGLGIVGDLARRHALPLSCHSRPGEGTRITLRLPKPDPAPVGTTQ